MTSLAVDTGSQREPEASNKAELLLNRVPCWPHQRMERSRKFYEAATTLVTGGVFVIGAAVMGALQYFGFEPPSWVWALWLLLMGVLLVAVICTGAHLIWAWLRSRGVGMFAIGLTALGAMMFVGGLALAARQWVPDKKQTSPALSNAAVDAKAGSAAEIKNARIASSAAPLERPIAYEPAGVSLVEGQVTAFKFGVVNNATTLMNVRLVSAELRVGDQVIGRVAGGRPVMLGNKQTAFWQISASGPEAVTEEAKEYIAASVSGTLGKPSPTPPASVGSATIEISYDDVPARGVRRSKILYNFPTNVGGYSATIASQEEF